MTSFRDYTMRSSALLTSMRAPRESIPEFKDTALKLVEDETAQPIIYDSPAEAIASLRLNRDRKTAKTSDRVIGDRGTPSASHIAYAWKPIVRRVGRDNRIGEVALHVLHATKGWKIVHGIYAPRGQFFAAPEPEMQVVGADAVS